MQNDRIKIKNLKVYAYHGVFDFEREKGQNFYVNAVFSFSLQKSGLKDDLEESVSYAEISTFIVKFMTEHTYQLIEAAVEHLSIALFHAFPKIQEMQLEIRKPEAPMEEEFESVSVEIYRKRHKAFIAFGSNMGDSKATIESAIHAMKMDECCLVKKVSSMIESAPYGGVEQDNFLNGVLELETFYSPSELLAFLQKIELEHGRTREIHWGPRTLDLDILFYDDLVLDTEELIIPHPDMANRDFVCGPLNEIAPYFRHPITKKTVAEMNGALTEKYIL